MKILVTGSSGFIGSHLTEYLTKLGHSVIAFDRYNVDNNYGWLENSIYKKKIKFILGDIRDYDSVNKAIKNVDAVIHLAALIGIPYSYISPTAYIKTNIEGTFNILESVKNNNIKQVLITSTSEVYGTAVKKKLNEKDFLKAQSPYAASKIGADQLALSYYKSFNTKVKIIRPFNTFGPRQSDRAIIPTIISQALSNKKNVSIGNHKSTRDFIYVLDLCSAIYKVLLSKNFYGEVVNIGTNKEISILKVVKIVEKILGKKIQTKQDKKRLRPPKSEVDRLRCDNSKLKKYTNWKQKYSFEEGIKELIMWMKEGDRFNKYKINQYNI